MARKQRFQQISEHFKNKEIVKSDAVLSSILEGTRETVGAILEGKNNTLERFLEQTTRKDAPRNRLAKGRRFVNRQGIHRALKTVSSLVDISGSMIIGSADIINNVQGEVHDIFTGNNTARGVINSTMRGVGDVVFRKGVRDTVRNSLIMNKALNKDFNLRSSRAA